MSLTALTQWLGVAALVLSIGNTLWAFLMRDLKTAASSISKMKDAMIEHDRRIQAIEGEMKHLPSKDDLIEIKLAISELKGTVGRVEESVAGTGRAVRRMQDYLERNKQT